MPVVYYATRTHAQVSQVIREFRKTSYRVPMAVLASRKLYCTNGYICGKENIDDECKKLLKAENVGCAEFKNVHRVKSHPSLQKGGYNEVHDIEDLVKVGQAVKGCSYFAARSMAEEALLVFCPYNYIISPTIRNALEIDLRGAIIILDEAHNVEDIARDAGSFDVEEELLDELQAEVGQLCLVEKEAMVYQPLHDLIQGIITWVGQKKEKLGRRELEHYFSCWTGNEALAELREAGLTQECFPILQECATKAIKTATDADVDGVHLSGKSTMILEGLFSSLRYFFSENGVHACDYQLALQKFVKRDGRYSPSGWTVSLSLWLLNPAVVFREIANLSLSIILTSGTLSPMGSFASELGVQFDTCMEAPHVIDVQSQLWAAVISTGPGNCRINASYKTADSFDFQDELGACLEEICKVVPGGALIFFPSYKLLEKLQSRWTQTGQWSRLHAQKSLFVEPRGSHEDFELILKRYYDSIQGSKRTLQVATKLKPKKGKKQSTNNAAAFLAVCRGKVSEGIDFADENARVVVVVGIPFPNINDIQVVLKKKHNDKYKTARNLLSGSQWYCYQAFRALNQAIGRCIRHRFDYGAVILLDERFKQEQNTAYISKWLKKSVRQYNNFNMSMEGLRNFFQFAKENYGQKDHVIEETVGLEDFATKGKPLTPKPLHNRASRKRDRKRDTLDLHTKEDVKVNLEAYVGAPKRWTSPVSPKGTDIASISELTVQARSNSSTEHIHYNVSDSRKTDSEYSEGLQETVSVALIESFSNESFGEEIPTMRFKEEISSALGQVCTEFSTEQWIPSLSASNASHGTETSCDITPERKTTEDFCLSEPEKSFSRSVNSFSKKRRMPLTLQMCSHSEVDPNISVEMNGSLLDTEQQTGLTLEPHLSSCRNWRFDMPKDPLNHLVHLDEDKKMQLRCLSCNTQLGLNENNFSVGCLPTLSSKKYLHTLKNSRLVSTWSTELLSNGSEPQNIPVVITDASSVNPCIYGGLNGEFAEPGFWCEEDGCVFRTVFCCFCPTGLALGVHVLAADVANTQLINKILFYTDRVLFNDHEDESEEKATLTVNTSNISQFSELASVEMKPCCQQSKDCIKLTSSRSKLQLPKRPSGTD